MFTLDFNEGNKTIFTDAPTYDATRVDIPGSLYLPNSPEAKAGQGPRIIQPIQGNGKERRLRKIYCGF